MKYGKTKMTQADFNPRGNVHTVVEIDSSKIIK